ncbi:MAG: hypothetical protein J6W60_07700 [Treponema sp.]|nr:hypothetical protein [Treponema sp.]
MKSIKKIAIAVLALGFVAMTQVFAAKAPTVVATFVGEVEEEETVGDMTLTFYSDKTFVVHIYLEGDMDMGEDMGTLTMKMDADAMAGTYKGDPKKDGKITLTITKTSSEDFNEETSLKVLSAMMSGEAIELTNEDMPLVDLPKKEWEKQDAEIKDNQILIDGIPLDRK